MSKKSAGSTNKYIDFSNNKLIRKFLGYPVGGLFVHWIFQGMLQMDKTELYFKLFGDVLLTFIMFLILHNYISWFWALLLAFVLSHTVNFIFNGQVYVVLKHYGYVRMPIKKYENYTNELRNRILSEKSINYAIIFGSFVRNERTAFSDLDIKLVRRKGISNAISSITFLVSERTRAFLFKFPLDIFLFDSEEQINKIRNSENPLVIKTFED